MKRLSLIVLILGSLVPVFAQKNECFEKYGTPAAWPDDCSCLLCDYEGLKALKACLCSEKDEKYDTHLLTGFNLYDQKNGVSLYYKQVRSELLFKVINGTNKPIYAKIHKVHVNTSRTGGFKKSITTWKILPGEAEDKGIFASTFNGNVIESWTMEKWEWREKAYPY